LRRADWLSKRLKSVQILSDPEFLAKMRRSRADQLAGKTRSIDELKKDFQLT
jgi:hypothetical protein